MTENKIIVGKKLSIDDLVETLARAKIQYPKSIVSRLSYNEGDVSVELSLLIQVEPMEIETTVSFNGDSE